MGAPPQPGGGNGALPMKQVLVLCFIQLCDFINGGAIYPYIIFMVQSFNVTDDDKKLGYFAGLLASSYYIAQLFSSMFWGIASDKIGRRPCLLIGLLCSMISVVVFGFSQSLIFAIITRFLSGLFNGNLGVTKTMLGEISTSENQARAFSFFGFTVAASGIAGPLIGGIFSNPSQKYPHVFGGVELFETYPFCLPNLIAGILSLVGLITGLIVLPETKVWKGDERNEFFSKIISKLPFMKPKTTFVKLRDLSGIGTQDGEDEDEKDEYITNDDTSIGTPTHGKVSFGKFKTKVEEEGEEEEKETTTEEGEKATSKWALLKDRGVLVSCLMYGVLGMIFVFYDEVNPYWSFLKVEDGGLGFTSTDNGIVTSVGSSIGMAFQMFIYPRIANKIGILKAFKIGALIAIPGLLLIPQTPLIALALSSNRDLKTNPISWAFLILAILLIQVGAELLFISIVIAISNSAMPETMGAVNGIAQSIVALTRGVGPIAGSSMLSWALTSGYSFPFNYQLPYLVLALSTAVLIGLTYVAPPSLNIQKKEALRKEREKQTLLTEEEEGV